MNSLTFHGLSQADAADVDELRDAAAADQLSLEEAVLDESKLGEPATFLLVAAATLTSIRVLAAFLQRKRRREKVRYTVEVVGPDGSRRTETLELERSESEAPTPELVEKLAQLADVPLDQLQGLLR